MPITILEIQHVNFQKIYALYTLYVHMVQLLFYSKKSRKHNYPLFQSLAFPLYSFCEFYQQGLKGVECLNLDFVALFLDS